jgi:hypothetical protein
VKQIHLRIDDVLLTTSASMDPNQLLPPLPMPVPSLSWSASASTVSTAPPAESILMTSVSSLCLWWIRAAH